MDTLKDKTAAMYKKRNAKIYMDWDKYGISHAEIAKEHGISRQAVQMICTLHRLRKEASK